MKKRQQPASYSKLETLLIISIIFVGIIINLSGVVAACINNPFAPILLTTGSSIFTGCLIGIPKILLSKQDK